MSRYLMSLHRQADRDKAIAFICKAPAGTRLEFKRPKRSLPQNDLMWSLLSELAEQLPCHGIRLTADDYKLVMLDALKRENRMVPNVDGNGFVNLGRSSSDLSKEEMSDLIALIEAFGIKHGVAFKDIAK